MTELEKLQARYNELDKEAGKYNRQGFDEVYKIISELVADMPNVGDRGNLALPLATGDVIDEALRKAGFADDAEFVADFKRYREIEQKARNIQLEGLNIAMKELPPKPAPSPDEWRFVPISIVAPKPIMDEVVQPMIESDATEGKGLFANVSDIPSEDEEEDILLTLKIYNCEATFTRYVDELKRFGVIGRGKQEAFFNVDFKRHLFKVLNGASTFIVSNTDKPATIKNRINEIVTAFDSVPIWGLFFQILTLQGLCCWLECVNINEGDNGYNEAVSLYEWLAEILADKEILFAHTPYGDEDKEQLKPLCDYLYSTELGKMVQQAIFGEPRTTDKGSVEAFKLPTELDTAEAGEKPTEPKQRGRKAKPFIDCFVRETKQTDYDKVKALCENKQGKDLALVILVAIKEGMMSKPTFRTIEKDCVNIGSESGFNKYISSGYSAYTTVEIDGMKKLLGL